MLFKILYFLFYFEFIYGQWYYSVLPQYYYTPIIYANNPSSDVCKDYRPDCRIFEYICGHPDYSWFSYHKCIFILVKRYMDCCCKNTCDEKCREKDQNDKDWEERRRRYKEMDINKKSYDQTIDNEAILNKYLGDIDKQNLLKDGELNRHRWDRNRDRELPTIIK